MDKLLYYFSDLYSLSMLALFTGFAYLFYWKVIHMYYKYYFYTSQGVGSTGFPLPFLANGLSMGRAM
jgi:hypothetical protein